MADHFFLKTVTLYLASCLHCCEPLSVAQPQQEEVEKFIFRSGYVHCEEAQVPPMRREVHENQEVIRVVSRTSRCISEPLGKEEGSCCTKNCPETAFFLVADADGLSSDLFTVFVLLVRELRKFERTGMNGPKKY